MKKIFFFFILFNICIVSLHARVNNTKIQKGEKLFGLKIEKPNKDLTNFWRWFQENEKKLYTRYIDNLNDIEKTYMILSEISEHLHNFSTGLHIEIEKKEKPLNLIITPQGIRKYFSDAYEAVHFSPQLKYWTTQATKYKSELKNFSIAQGNIKVDNSDLSFVPIKDTKYPDKVIIKIIHPNYDEKSSSKGYFQTAIYNIIDETIGEISASFDIDYIKFSNKSYPSEKKLPISKLEDYLYRVKSSRKFYKQEFLPDEITILKGEKNDKPSTLLVNFNYNHYSFKEKYPYLLNVKIIFNKTTEYGWPEDIEAILSIDNLIIDTILKKENGHFIYSEMHNGQRIIGIQCKNKKLLKTSIGILKKKIKTHKIEYAISFDPMWFNVQKYLNYK